MNGTRGFGDEKGLFEIGQSTAYRKKIKVKKEKLF